MQYFLDHYSILEVPFGATQEEIKKSFRRLAKIWHPDKHGDPYKFHQIYISYQFLMNKENREKYNEIYKKILKNRTFFSQEIKKILPDEFKSSLTLKKILQEGIKLSKFSKFDRYFLLKINYDYVLSLNSSYISKTLLFHIPISIKTLCKECYGSDLECNFCNGLGWYTTQTIIKVLIPPNILHNFQIIEIDLKKIKLKIPHAYPKNSFVKILIEIK